MSDKDVVQRAQANYKQDKKAWNNIYTKAREDMHFLSDEKNAQWSDDDLKVRGTRPTLTIDQLGQFVHQVSNDIRMNTPTITILPNGSEASIETAEVLKGLIKNI